MWLRSGGYALPGLTEVSEFSEHPHNSHSSAEYAIRFNESRIGLGHAGRETADSFASIRVTAASGCTDVYTSVRRNSSTCCVSLSRNTEIDRRPRRFSRTAGLVQGRIYGARSLTETSQKVPCWTYSTIVEWSTPSGPFHGTSSRPKWFRRVLLGLTVRMHRIAVTSNMHFAAHSLSRQRSWLRHVLRADYGRRAR